jgi:4-hydroxybenzoate polyprenyltransferase
MYFLQLIRWKNLLLIAFIQLLIVYYLLPFFDITNLLSNIEFAMIVVATLLIAASGNIINDIYDIEIDKINKPEELIVSRFISIKNARRSYFIINIVALSIAFSVSILQNHPLYSLLFFLPQLLLYFYATSFKKIAFLGNAVVSLLVAFSIVIVAVFENVLSFHLSQNIEIGHIIWGLVFFAFSINLIREIIKDIEDIIGDKAFNIKSIPVKYGIKKTHTFIKTIVYLLITSIILIVLLIFKKQIVLCGYLLLAVAPSLLLFLEQLSKVKTTKDYKKLSILLKIIMLVGILSIFMLTRIIHTILSA